MIQANQILNVRRSNQELKELLSFLSLDPCNVLFPEFSREFNYLKINLVINQILHNHSAYCKASAWDESSVNQTIDRHKPNRSQAFGLPKHRDNAR